MAREEENWLCDGCVQYSLTRFVDMLDCVLSKESEIFRCLEWTLNPLDLLPKKMGIW